MCHRIELSYDKPTLWLGVEMNLLLLRVLRLWVLLYEINETQFAGVGAKLIIPPKNWSKSETCSPLCDRCLLLHARNIHTRSGIRRSWTRTRFGLLESGTRSWSGLRRSWYCTWSGLLWGRWNAAFFFPSTPSSFLGKHFGCGFSGAPKTWRGTNYYVDPIGIATPPEIWNTE